MSPRNPTAAPEACICSRCHESKPPSAFNVNNARPSGRTCACTDCLSAKRRAKAKAAADMRRYEAAKRERLEAIKVTQPVRTYENVVYPLDCLDSACPRLRMVRYDGCLFMGCDAGVWTQLIDVHKFRVIQARGDADAGQRGGFGPVPMKGLPTGRCRRRMEMCEVYG